MLSVANKPFRLIFIMLNVVMQCDLGSFMLSAAYKPIMLIVIMLNVVMQSVIYAECRK